MKLGALFERAIGLGVRDEPRPVAVGAKRDRPSWNLLSTPGAELVIQRDGWDGEVQRALVGVLQAGWPVELRTGEPAIFWKGQPMTVLELRALLRGGRRRAV